MQITQRIIATCIYISVCVVILLFTGTHINTIDVIQPDANVVYFHEVETRTEQPLQFRWAANDATLIFPYNSVGMQIFTFTATTLGLQRFNPTTSGRIESLPIFRGRRATRTLPSFFTMIIHHSSAVKSVWG